MRILYVAFVRLPTEKAHGLQIMKVCEALAQAGAAVELVIPGRKTSIAEDPFTYYGVERTFSIVPLPGLDFMGWGRLGFILSQLLFGARAAAYARQHTDAIVISQDEWSLGTFLKEGRPYIYEVHNGRGSARARTIATHAKFLVANSLGTKAFYEQQGIPEERILVLPNGVDVTRFNPTETKEEARTKLGLPLDTKLVMYTGHLYDWKGADTLARAALSLPESVRVVFVGGTEADVARFKRTYGHHPQIMILGHKPNRDMPLYLRAADLLVLPNDRIGESERFTSPMKLFEYLAAGKPIVASDLPSIREVVDEQSVFLFPAGSVVGLAEVLQTALKHTEDAQARAHRSAALAAEHTWDRSALIARIASLQP